MRIEAARSPEEIAAARRLLLDYRAEMRADLCFVAYTAEVDGLPGEYGPPGGELLVAWDGDREVGCVAVHAIGGGEGLCEMKRLYVRPEARGRGLGRQLATRIIEIAREKGYGAMRLDTLPMMREAIAMYRTLGFREIHAYRHNPVEGVLFLELDLLGAGDSRAGRSEHAPALVMEFDAEPGAIDGSSLAWLRARAARLAPEVATRFGARGAARVRIVRDDAMSAAHEKHTGQPGPTDVLTFNYAAPAGCSCGGAPPPCVDADILVCVDEAKRNVAERAGGAAAEAEGVARELLLYALHGTLHCLGFDDHDDEGFARMHAAEDEILEAVGVGRVFAG